MLKDFVSLMMWLWTNCRVNAPKQDISHCFQCISYKVQFLTHLFCLSQQLPCKSSSSPLPRFLCRGFSSGFSGRRRYERDASGRQSGDAGKGERGEDESRGAICSPSLLGWPVPERECQLLRFSFPRWPVKGSRFKFSPGEANRLKSVIMFTDRSCGRKYGCSNVTVCLCKPVLFLSQVMIT